MQVKQLHYMLVVKLYAQLLHSSVHV